MASDADARRASAESPIPGSGCSGGFTVCSSVEKCIWFVMVAWFYTPVDYGGVW